MMPMFRLMAVACAGNSCFNLLDQVGHGVFLGLQARFQFGKPALNAAVVNIASHRDARAAEQFEFAT